LIVFGLVVGIFNVIDNKSVQCGSELFVMAFEQGKEERQNTNIEF
jgi:hypothetical protein